MKIKTVGGKYDRNGNLLHRVIAVYDKGYEARALNEFDLVLDDSFPVGMGCQEEDNGIKRPIFYFKVAA